MTHDRKSKTYLGLNLTVLILCASAAVWINAQLVFLARDRTTLNRADSESAVSFRWHPTLYKILSVGQLPAAVDWLLIRFMADPNWSKVKLGQQTELFRILDLATEIDPAFFLLYVHGSNYLGVVRNDIDGAVKLVTKGDRFREFELPKYPSTFRNLYWGKTWRLSMVAGYLFLVEKMDIPAAQKHYENIARDPGAPSELAALSRSMQSIEGQFKVALNTIFVIKKWYEDDPRLKEDIELKEKYLRLGRILFLANRDLNQVSRLGDKNRQAKFSKLLENGTIPRIESFDRKLYLDAEGRVVSDTPLTTIFGMDLKQTIYSEETTAQERK